MTSGPLRPLFGRLILEVQHYQEMVLPSFCLSLRTASFPFSFFLLLLFLGSISREVGGKGKHELNVRQGTWEWEPAVTSRRDFLLLRGHCRARCCQNTANHCKGGQSRKELSSRKFTQQCLAHLHHMTADGCFGDFGATNYRQTLLKPTQLSLLQNTC